MPVTLTQLAQNKVEVTFPYAGESITLAYYPAKLTESVMADMDILADKTNRSLPENMHAANGILAQLLATWDVLNDDGTMYPFDPEHLAQVPILFRFECITQISNSFSPNAMGADQSVTKPPLDAISSSDNPPALPTSLSGTPSSEPPAI